MKPIYKKPRTTKHIYIRKTNTQNTYKSISKQTSYQNTCEHENYIQKRNTTYKNIHNKTNHIQTRNAIYKKSKQHNIQSGQPYTTETHIYIYIYLHNHEHKPKPNTKRTPTYNITNTKQDTHIHKRKPYTNTISGKPNKNNTYNKHIQK